MILYISYRTDIPAFYGEWLYNRFQEGYLLQRNPMNPHKLTKIKLDNTIDSIVFCSKNYKPFMKYIPYFEKNFNCYYNYTINAYGKDIEPHVPSHDIVGSNLIELSNIVGKNKVAWRYDPILFTDDYDMQFHKSSLDYLIDMFGDKVDRCIFSFVSTIYPIVKKNIPNLIDPTEEQKDEILWHIENISDACGLTFQTCGHGKEFIDKHPKIHCSGCTTIDILEHANNIQFNKLVAGNKRPGCLCVDGRNVGDYNTCNHDCKYCYAVRQSYINAKYDVNSPILLGEIEDRDEIIDTPQKSNLIVPDKQLTFNL